MAKTKCFFRKKKKFRLSFVENRSYQQTATQKKEKYPGGDSMRFMDEEHALRDVLGTYKNSSETEKKGMLERYK